MNEQLPLLEKLSKALKPTWQEFQLAGRVSRHIGILRDIAHELSNAEDREDRPQTAQEARTRFEQYLENLDILTPRAGLASRTGDFIDDIKKRYSRYAEHLFVCFDDARIPSTTNELEGFFGGSKQALRRALGCGSTSNSVVSNLGSEALIAYHQIKDGRCMEELRRNTFSVEEFKEVRFKLSVHEAPMIRQRSMVRHLNNHLDRLWDAWFAPNLPTEAYA